MTRRPTSVLVAALAAAGGGLFALLGAAPASPAQEGGPPPAPAPAPAPAPGEERPKDLPADTLKEVRKLRDEGRALFNSAGDPDLTRDERKKARQESYKKLMRARELFNAWIEAHPDDAENLQDLESDINITLLWLRKEAGIGEFDSGAAKPKPAPVTPPAPAPAAAPPAPPKPPSPEDELEKIRLYEKAHPGDVPGLHERYSRFLTDFPDRTLPPYEEAFKRVEELGLKLKDVYRRARDDDPDALAGADPAEVEKLVDQLLPDLKSPDPAVRQRAARFLGGLGSGRAAQSLVEALLAEKEADPLEGIRAALAKIGGRRVCDRLAKEKPGGPTTESVIDVFLRMVKNGGVTARIAGESVAGFVKTLDEATRASVAEGLCQAGKDGAMGLALLVDLVPVDKKVGYIESLGKVGEPRAAGNLARFLKVNPEGARRRQHQAAVQAITEMGKPAVRWLIPALDDPGCQVWTAELLRQLTGAKLKDDKRKTWEKWFQENRKAIEGK